MMTDETNKGSTGSEEMARRTENIPSDAGRRARIDPATGEVQGSGVGAGGGASGEDYDSDPAGGSTDRETPDSPPQTPVEDQPDVDTVKPADYPDR